MSNLTRSILCRRNYLGSFLGVQDCDAKRAFSDDSEIDALKMARPYEVMPKVPMIPMLGSSWAYLPVIGKYSINKLHKADIDKNRIYGDVVRERFGSFEVVSSYHPDTMRILAENEGMHPSRSDFSSLKMYRQQRKRSYEPEGFLVSQGKEWHDIRDCLTRYLADPKYLSNYMEPLNKIAKDLVRLISSERDGNKEVKDAVTHLRKWALECILQVTLDGRLGCLTPGLPSQCDPMKLLKAVETQLACMYKLEASSGNFPLWKYLPTPTWLKFKRAADTFTALSHNYINNSVHLSTSKYGKLMPRESPNFLQFIILGEGLNLSHAVITVSDIILAGLDTTSHTAGFLLYNLAKNPEKQELAYQEIMKVLPNEEDQITMESYEKLGYLKSCLKESMRLHPTVRGNVRVLDRDVAISGYRVPAGTAIICVLQVIHRNEKYFKNAERFIPERWDDKETMNMNEFAFQPFGYGKRSCLGKNLAEMEIVMLTAELLRKYVVEYHYDDIDMCTKLINVPDKPLRFKFLERMPTRGF